MLLFHFVFVINLLSGEIFKSCFYFNVKPALLCSELGSGSSLGHCSLFAISLPPVNYIAVFSVDLQLRLTSEDIRFALVL